MTLPQVLNLAPPLLFVLFHVAEAIAPAQPLPRSLGWRIRGFLWFVLSGALYGNAPLLLLPWTAGHRLFDSSSIGLWGAPLAVLVVELIGYWWHRLRHGTTALWRMHQLHHSAERLDISGAFMFHPLESVVMGTLFAVTSTCVLGVSSEAAALAGLIGFFFACFQHANLRTPRWLGYLVQRPESHSLHHARGVHAFNYADLPVFDLLFGTFRNPERREQELGFYDGASRRLGTMLLGLDNQRPQTEQQAPVGA